MNSSDDQSNGGPPPRRELHNGHADVVEYIRVFCHVGIFSYGGVDRAEDVKIVGQVYDIVKSNELQRTQKDILTSFLMRYTHNSLSTIISWVSSCLLAGGLSTLFNESSRFIWISWGSFGLAAAVGLDVTARVRERKRIDGMKVTANKRFDRDMEYATDDKEANAAVREAIARILGRTPPAMQMGASRRTQLRYACDLEVELHLRQGPRGAAGNDGISTRLARVTHLSESGFELSLTEHLPHRRMEMIIEAANGRRQTMFGEVLWDGPKGDGSIVAGGRFLDADPVEGD